MKKADMNEIIELVNESEDIIIGSVDEQGYPTAKAMMKLVHEGLQTFYFSTFTAAIRTQQYRKNSKACLYFYRSTGKVGGLMLTGHMAVLTDTETKQKYWQDEWKIYYPLGVTDPNYCILKFTAKSGSYTCGEKKIFFER